MNHLIAKSVLSTILLAGSLAMAGGPLSPAEYLKRLSAASTHASPEVSQAFLMNDPRNPDKVPSIVEEIGSVAQYADESSLSLVKAQKHPQYYVAGGYDKGGLAVWNNDAFPVDFFVRKFDSWKTGEAPLTSTLLKTIAQQPWFKWQGNALVLQTSGASARMLDLLQAQQGGKTVKLYRGTTAFEADVFELQKKLSNGETLPSNWRETLTADQQAIVDHTKSDLATYEDLLKGKYVSEADVAAKRVAVTKAQTHMDELIAKMENAKDDQAIGQFLREAVTDLMGNGLFKGLFTTPSEERAEVFSKGRVLEMEVSYDTLRSVLAEGQLFVGMEKMILEGGLNDIQVEIMFTTDAAGEKLAKLIDIVLKSYRGSTAVAAGHQFN